MADDRPKELLAFWRAGDQKAAEELYRNYAGRLIALARSRLSAKLAQRIDPEDVVQSAYRSFFADSREGRYDVQCGTDLWHLLLTITLHKLQCQVQRHTAQKRAVEQEQTFGSEDSLHGIQSALHTRSPSPVEAVALIDEVEQVMRRLDPPQRRIVELRLQGYHLEEIAEQVACSRRPDRGGNRTDRFLERVNEPPGSEKVESSGDRFRRGLAIAGRPIALIRFPCKDIEKRNERT